MVAFLATYLLFLGFTQEGVSWLLGGTMVGVILFQVPVAWLADRYGRQRILLGCYAVVAGGLICMPLSAGSGWLGIWLFLLGACSSAFYPLGLALMGERVSGFGLARANAWYLALNCLGSLIGPVLTGKAMDLFGKSALFAVGEGAVLLVLAAWGLTALRARRARQRATSSPVAEKEERVAA
jgi:MFS family permease